MKEITNNKEFSSGSHSGGLVRELKHECFNITISHVRGAAFQQENRLAYIVRVKFVNNTGHGTWDFMNLQIWSQDQIGSSDHTYDYISHFIKSNNQDVKKIMSELMLFINNNCPMSDFMMSLIKETFDCGYREGKNQIKLDLQKLIGISHSNQEW